MDQWHPLSRLSWNFHHGKHSESSVKVFDKLSFHSLQLGLNIQSGNLQIS
jgi:hypothetical protein